MSIIEKILLVIVGAVLVIGIGWIIFGGQNWLIGVTGPNGQPLNYNQAKQAEDPNNPCVPPPGYSAEAWREHMSHHPDEYKQCLGK